MAQFELQMRHTTLPMQVGMRIVALLFPVWGIALPTLLALFIVMLLRLPANIPLTSSLLIIFSITGTIALCTLLAFYFEDDKVRVSKEGLAFPLKFLPDLKFKREHQWQDLLSVTLHWQRQKVFQPDDSLTLMFANGGYATLKLDKLDLEELEQFFIAFEACAYKCQRDSDLPDFEQAIQTKKLGTALSHTELWEKSLALRFSGATFIPLEPGSRLQEGRWQIMRQLAFGGFSAIYLARKTEGNFVVLKESTFSLSATESSKASELFQREASILSKLDHPSISRIIDYFVENDRHYLVMQHVEGIDLNRLVLTSGPQAPDTVLNWALQLAEALVYLHNQSPPIVHRDIAPDNLLLKPDGSLILIDFGAAKEIVLNFTGTIVGKQSYMAPEQFKGKPCPKSDVYSFGATLFFLTTGKNPEPLTQTSIFMPEMPEVSLSALNDLIFRATALDANERPDFVEISETLKGLKVHNESNPPLFEPAGKL